MHSDYDNLPPRKLGEEEDLEINMDHDIDE